MVYAPGWSTGQAGLDTLTPEASTSTDITSEEALTSAETGLQDIIDLLSPELGMRAEALSAYQDILSGATDITQQAGYQQGLQSGQASIGASAAARGMQLSGANLENLAAFGTNYYQSQRTQALNELAGLAGMGQMAQQSTIGAMGEMASLPMQMYQMQLAAESGQAASAAAGLSGLGSLLGGAGMAYLAFSDIRVKQDIRYVDTVRGIDMYSFEYKPEIGIEGKYLGVLAQEIMDTYPEAVILGWNGYMMVDYSKLPVDFKKLESK